MKSNLLDAAGIWKHFGFTKASFRKMRDSIGLPETVTLEGDEVQYKKYGLKPGVEYYKISDFEDLKKKGILEEFIK